MIEELLTQHQVQEDGSGQKTIRAKVLVKDHAAVSEWSTLVFPYLAITERFSLSRLEIEKPDGRRVTASSLTAEDVAVPGQLDGPILSDLRGKRIVVPTLQPGDRLTYEAVVTRSESLVPGHFWIDHEFTRNAVVMSEAFEIDVPSARSFNIRVRRGTEEPERPAASGRRIRRWIHQQAVPQTPQAGASVLEALLEEAKTGQTFASRLDREFATYRSTYKVEGHTLRLERRLRTLANEVPLAQVDSVQETDRNRSPRQVGTSGSGQAVRRVEAVRSKDGLAWESLGRVRLERREAEAAVMAFERAVELAPNPGTWHGIARTLTEKGVGLDSAERYVRMAIARVVKDLSSVGLDRVQIEHFQAMRFLPVYWDTLGWIAIKTGDFVRGGTVVAWRVAARTGLRNWRTLGNRP